MREPYPANGVGVACHELLELHLSVIEGNESIVTVISVQKVLRAVQRSDSCNLRGGCRVVAMCLGDGGRAAALFGRERPRRL
jgi:hypothetical protein